MLPKETELDPRVRRTRQLLVDSFMQLLAEHGFTSLSVQDITTRAQVNRATFYAHFADKYALLDHAMGEAFRRELDSQVLNACQFSMENLRVLIATVCSFLGNLHGHCSASDAQFQSLVESRVREQVYELVLHWLEKLDTVQECTVSRERAATAASWAIYGLGMEWVRVKRLPPVGQYSREILPLVALNLGQTIEIAPAT